MEEITQEENFIEDSLLSAIHRQTVPLSTPIDMLLETMRGIDELSLSDFVDKSSCALLLLDNGLFC
jgi:hypothetical protein